MCNSYSKARRKFTALYKARRELNAVIVSNTCMDYTCLVNCVSPSLRCDVN